MNIALKQAWFNLLTIQKQVEAVKLEFTANQAIAGMNAVKQIPEIKGKGDSSKKSNK